MTTLILRKGIDDELLDDVTGKNDLLGPDDETLAGDTATDVKLKQSISVLNGIGLIVGSIIGSGVFISPTGILEQVNSIGLSMLIWLACGLFSLGGAICYAELGTVVKKSGGEYSYLKFAVGPVPAFLYAWTSTMIIKPSAMAIISLIFAEYVCKPFYDGCSPPIHLMKLLAFICIAVITLINCISVKWAVRVQDGFTYAKLVCVAILTVIGLIELGKGHTQFFNNSFEGSTTDVGKIGLAFYVGLWAYDGWNTLNYVTEEMKNPSRDLPLSITISLVLVTVCYVLVNVAYIAVLGKDGILASSAVALSVGDSYLGPVNWIIPILVAASTFGAVNGLAFSNGRLVYAAAREGHMPSLLAMIHSKRFTPLPSLIFTSLISCIMLIPDASEFSTLVDFFSFASWLFYGACFAVLIYLRIKQPHLDRPYKVFIGIPILMLLVSLFLIITPIMEQPVGSVIALAIIIAGLPFYFIFIRSTIVPDAFYRAVDAFTRACQKLCLVVLPEDESKFVG